MLSRSHCPYTGVVNFFARTEPLLAVGSVIKAGQPAGEAVRALAWLGPVHAREALKTLRQKLPESEFRALGPPGACSRSGWPSR